MFDEESGWYDEEYRKILILGELSDEAKTFLRANGTFHNQEFESGLLDKIANLEQTKTAVSIITWEADD